MPQGIRFALSSMLLVTACATDTDLPASNDDRGATDLGVEDTTPAGRRVDGVVRSLADGHDARVILANDGFLASRAVAADGTFSFAGVPDGRYYLKLDVAGYATSATQVVTVGAALPRIELTATALASNVFAFAWTEDASRAGHEQSSAIASVHAAEQTLRDTYNVRLSDDDQPWTQEHAARLLQMMAAVPQPVHAASTPSALRPVTWILTAGTGLDDLEVMRGATGDLVRISMQAFTAPAPRMIVADGHSHDFFSRRLHRAVVRYVTHDGADPAATQRVLRQRFGVTTQVADYAMLTATTTHETAASFAAFQPQELVELISILEEMPAGFRALPGLHTLVRRKDGLRNPVDATKTVIAFEDPGYLELTGAAFTADPAETHRAILREKAHFVISPSLEAAWAPMNGGDLPDAIADFVLAPDAMRLRSAAGYALIDDEIMHGALDLDPDATAPGDIVSVAIQVAGGADADKHVIVELGLRTDPAWFAGATSASLRMFSDLGTYADIDLQPVADGAVVRGETTISRFAQGGYWRPGTIVIRDQDGSPWVHSVSEVGWKLYLQQ